MLVASFPHHSVGPRCIVLLIVDCLPFSSRIISASKTAMALPTPDSFTKLKAICVCGQLTATLEVPTAALPLDLYFCHCSTCRHVSGTLCITALSNPEGSKLMEVHGKAKIYKTSLEIWRCFCGTCGTSVYEGSPDPKRTALCPGALEDAEGMWKFDSHTYVAATQDGGLRDWVPNDIAWEGWDQKSERVPEGTMFQKSMAKASISGLQKPLHARCHCGGVQFDITRPDENSWMAFSHWPDLLRPFHLGREASENHDDVKWWLRANDTKYLAGICACNSCRKASGFDVQPWAFIPRANIQQDGGRPMDFGMGTLRQYSSSLGSYRNFCGECGAMVFWHSDERPTLIDVSVGLLEAESGARAEEWLDWCTERVSFAECAQKKSLVMAVASGLREWGRQRNLQSA